MSTCTLEKNTLEIQTMVMKVNKKEKVLVTDEEVNTTKISDLPEPENYLGWFWCRTLEDYAKEAKECLDNGYPTDWVIISLHCNVVNEKSFLRVLRALHII